MRDQASSAYAFASASNDYLDFGENNTLSYLFQNDHSVTFAAKLNQSSDLLPVFGLGHGKSWGLWNGVAFVLKTSGGNFVVDIYRNDDTASERIHSVQGEAFDTEWHLFTITYDRDTFTYTLYQNATDGFADGNVDTTAHYDVVYNGAIPGYYVIMGRKDGYDDPSVYGDGAVDQLIIHNRVLTTEQISDLHKNNLHL